MSINIPPRELQNNLLESIPIINLIWLTICLSDYILLKLYSSRALTVQRCSSAFKEIHAKLALTNMKYINVFVTLSANNRDKRFLETVLRIITRLIIIHNPFKLNNTIISTWWIAGSVLKI